MTDTLSAPTTAVDPIPGGPYDIEFFFDPGCPFAWQTSVWIRRVIALRDIKVGWRFISLRFINEHHDLSPDRLEGLTRGLRYHRICAAARERLGNDAVAQLYQAYGTRYWYVEAEGDFGERSAIALQQLDPAAIIADLGLPADLLAEADNEAWDAVIRAESDEAFRRTGPDVGTPIITYDPPTGNSLFGPVISAVPRDDETVLAFYDALRVFADFPAFSELKRTDRAGIDLPLLR